MLTEHPAVKRSRLEYESRLKQVLADLKSMEKFAQKIRNRNKKIV